MYIESLSPENSVAVIALEQSVESGWSGEAVRRELDRHLGLQLVACESYAGTAIGWCCGFRVGKEAELLRIAVAISERQKGVASVLLAQFEKECTGQQVSSVFLEVAETNVAARRLYAQFSYKQVGRRKDYYSQPVDDALVMSKVLI